jgi:hypothetical protein
VSFAVLAAAGWLILAAAPAAAQQAPTAPPPAAPQTSSPSDLTVPPSPDSSDNQSPSDSGDSDGFSVRNSSVGYIDPAFVFNQFRLRYDDAFGNNRPTRAEFFWARTGPAGPGLPLPEKRVDYQDVSAYLEKVLCPRVSVFAEVPYRFLNPEVNANAAGLADMNAGLKWNFYADEERLLTFQFRTYMPTGDIRAGLSTGHASVEPALLFFQRLGANLALEGELRYWAPVGGTNFAGDVVRYGLGLGYNMYQAEGMILRPVAEIVGWTVLGGREAFTTPTGTVIDQSAGGDTIVNVKLGVRSYLGPRTSIYAGYGRPLTGEVWYKDTLRAELRVAF